MAADSTTTTTTADTQASTAAITATYLSITTLLRARLLAIVATLFAQSGSYRAADATAFVTAALPITLAAQRTMAALTDAYLTQVIAATAGGTSAPIGVASGLVSGAALRNGADPATVYRRPYTEVWTDLAQGAPFDAAVAAGARRLESITATDLQLARTHASQLVLARDTRVVGYRRVLGENPRHCALCVIASTQRYHTADLMPIHPACSCSVAPIVGRHDPGRVIDAVTLNNLHKTVERDLGPQYVDRGGRKGLAHYRDIVITNDHGELGPVLGVRGQHFDGPGDIARLTHDALPTTVS